MAYVNLPYHPTVINLDDLKLDKAKEFAAAVAVSHFSKLIECVRFENGDEGIVFDTEPEVGQKSVNPIHFVERVAVQFELEDRCIPWVYAMREDFPLVSHLNSMPFEFPRSLCLFEKTYEDLKIDWRGILYLERIREWLSLTAAGRLHQEDQPMEPFMINIAGTIIIPGDLKINEELTIYRLKSSNKWSFIAHRNKQSGLEQFGDKILPVVFMLSPQVHGIIRRTPLNLKDLHEVLLQTGFNLIEGELKPKISTHFNRKELYQHKIVFILIIPKKREVNGHTVGHECITFITRTPLIDLAIAINLWFTTSGITAPIFPVIPFDDKASSVEIVPLSTYTPFSRSKANLLSGIQADDSCTKIALIGVGALGSQIFMNLTRMGYGQWLLIDDDILLPHNLARHFLTDSNLGFSKSESCARISNELLADSQHAAFLHENYLKPLDQQRLQNELSQFEIILDISASLPVARKLANDNLYLARRISIFLNPDGTDLVILAENQLRTIRLDCIEMQYYRFLLNQSQLHLHLVAKDPTVRYSNSCRDITSRISQDLLSILSGIASKALRATIRNNAESRLAVWKVDEHGAVALFESVLYEAYTLNQNGWEVVFDEFILKKIQEARAIKLPLETGGILIGSFDMSRKIIYIVDTILSPKDSKEYPTAYYRGIDGLGTQLLDISKITSGNLLYVGEWHSHPNGYSVSPSEDDKTLFTWLKKHMTELGLPALMLIVGHDAQNFIVE